MKSEDWKNNRLIRIFISSTFNDMQEERNYLVDKIFPVMRKKAAERNVELTEIDLRWGIKKLDSESGRTVSICMEEIDNSRPFFIGLLGHRYGSTAQELNGACEYPEKYSWLQEDLNNGLSITEIEIQYGALRRGDAHAAFYIKSNPYTTQEGKLKTYKTDERQERLRGKIRKQSLYPTQEYHHLKELGECVQKDFAQLLDELYPQDESPSVEELTRLSQMSFMKRKSSIYVSDNSVEYKLNSYIQNGEPYIMLVAPSGMGKSSLLSNWILNYDKPMDYKISTYFVGSMPNESLSQLLNFLIADITKMYDMDNLQPTDQVVEDERLLVDLFSQLVCSIVTDIPLIIVLDGLDRMKDENDNVINLDWLPAHLPEHVHIVLSVASESPLSSYFTERQMATIKLHPLLADQRLSLINKFFLHYRKQMDPEGLELIMKNRSVLQNTLMLSLFLDEVRRIGVFENMGIQIKHLTDCQTAAEFFTNIIQLKELKYNTKEYPHFVKQVLSMIAVSKEGFTETEILEITKVPPLYWSYFYCGSPLLFANINGKINFSHPMIKQVVWDLYLQNKEYLQVLRFSIIFYLRTECPQDAPLIYSELPWQLLYQKDWESLYQYLSTEDYLLYAMDGHQQEFLKYWGQLLYTDPEKYDISIYATFINDNLNDALEQDIVTDDNKKNMLRELYWSGMGHSYLQLAQLLLSRLKAAHACEAIVKNLIQQYQDIGYKRLYKQYAFAYHLLASALTEQKKFEESLRIFDMMLKVYAEIYGEDAIETTRVLVDMAENYSIMGEQGDKTALEKARELDEQALTIRLKHYGPKHEEVAVIYANLASIYSCMGDNQRADEYQQKSIVIYKNIGHNGVFDLAIEYRNRAARLLDEEKFAEAESYARKAVKTMSDAVGTDNVNMKDCWLALSQALEGQGKFDEATKALEYFFEFFVKEKTATPYEQAYKLEGMANMMIKFQKWNEAANYASKFLAALKKAHIDDPSKYAMGYETFGKAIYEAGDLDMSLKAFKHADQLYVNEGMTKHQARTKINLSSILHAAGKDQEALSIMNDAIQLLTDNELEYTEEAVLCFMERAKRYYEQGHKTGTIQDLNTAFDIRTQLFGPDDSMALEIKDDIAKVSQKENEEENIKKGETQEPFISEGKMEQQDVPPFLAVAEDCPKLCELFRKGCQLFDQKDMIPCYNTFNQALNWCNMHGVDSNDIKRAHIMRLWAFASEPFEKNLSVIQNAYEEAIDIACSNNDMELAVKCCSDMTEFNWNKKRFDIAERGYIRQIYYMLNSINMDARRLCLAMSNIPQTFIKRDFINAELIIDISYVVMMDARELEMDFLVDSALKTANAGVQYLKMQQEDFDPEGPGISFWNCLQRFTRYLMGSEYPQTAVLLLEHEIKTSLKDLDDPQTQNMFATLRLHTMYYADELNYPEWSANIADNTLKQLSSNICDENLLMNIYHKKAISCMRCMRFEDAGDILNYAMEPDGIIKAAECYYQRGQTDKALEKLQQWDQTTLENLEIPELLTVLKIALDQQDIQLAHNAYQLLQEQDKEKTETEAIVMDIYSILKDKLQHNDKQVVLQIQEIIASLKEYETKLPDCDMAHIYRALIDVLFRCDLYEEAKVMLANYEDFIKEFFGTDNSFWDDYEELVMRF